MPVCGKNHKTALSLKRGVQASPHKNHTNDVVFVCVCVFVFIIEVQRTMCCSLKKVLIFLFNVNVLYLPAVIIRNIYMQMNVFNQGKLAGI